MTRCVTLPHLSPSPLSLVAREQPLRWPVCAFTSSAARAPPLRQVLKYRHDEDWSFEQNKVGALRSSDHLNSS